MNREQAVKVIKDISEQCNLLEGKSLKLLPPKDNDTLSNTFQVHIQTHDDPDPFLIRCVERVAEEHKLVTKQVDGYLIVYKPYPITK